MSAGRSTLQQRVRRHRNHEPSAWLRGQLQHLERRVLSGQLQGCGHVPAVVALHASVLSCWACAPRHLPSADTVARCDRCGITTEHVYTFALRPGALAVFVEVCPACRALELGGAS